MHHTIQEKKTTTEDLRSYGAIRTAAARRCPYLSHASMNGEVVFLCNERSMNGCNERRVQGAIPVQ